MSEPRCPLCKRSYKKKPKCGLTLFHSENECAICLERPGKMIALPCGHQFCEEDLNKLGMYAKEKKKKKRKRGNVHPTRAPVRRRTGGLISLQPADGNRCGFCGHLGHTVRTCDAHKDKCGCDDYRSVVHIDIQRGQTRCSTCRRRGHEPSFCSVVVLA